MKAFNCARLFSLFLFQFLHQCIYVLPQYEYTAAAPAASASSSSAADLFRPFALFSEAIFLSAISRTPVACPLTKLMNDL